MTSARRKSILRCIIKNRNRFFSILFIVALGSGFMAGLAATSPDMYETADSYIDEYGMYDIDIRSPLGLTADDIKAAEMTVSESCNKSSMQPCVIRDMTLETDSGISYTSRIYATLNEGNQINNTQLISGRMPEDDTECVVESFFDRYSGNALKEGDVLTISNENSDISDWKTGGESLTVVGIVRGPLCISIEADSTNAGSGVLDINVYTKESFFDAENYTDVFFKIDEATPKNTFDDEYWDVINPVKKKLEALADERILKRRSDLDEEINQNIESLEHLDETLKKIEPVQKELRSDQAIRLDQMNEVINILKNSDAQNPDMQKTDLLWGDSVQWLANSLENIKGAADKKDSTPDEQGSRTGEIEGKITDLRDTLESLNSTNWFVMTRKDNSGYKSYDSNVRKVAALSKIFPVFFFLVALLVALTTMTRLVEEQRTQIGTLKALGFSNFQILTEYMIFSMLASVLGCFIGLAVGLKVFPEAINSAYSMMYYLPELKTPIRADISATIAPVTILSIMLATLWACWSEFRSHPAALMVPKAPPSGKHVLIERITPLWRRLSFIRKVTFRNLFRYKKRLFMTITGVAGCSALLVTGFGLRDSINDILNKQYGEIYSYDLTLISDASNNRQVRDIVEGEDRIGSYLPCHYETGSALRGGKDEEVRIVSPENMSDLPDFISLRQRKGGDPVSLPQKGVVLTEKLCEVLNVSKGDTITLKNEDGAKADLTVEGITENYISDYAYLTSETYRAAFNTKPQCNELLCKYTQDADFDKVNKDILKSGYVTYARSSISIKDSFADSLKSIDGVIFVLIAAAGLLCIVVLYNLINVNICERRKELATIRVLGFFQREVQQYIFREVNALSFIGSVLGLLAGRLLHGFVVKTVEVDGIMFGREISPVSYILAVLVTMAFTFLVNLIMRRAIRNVDMVEAMKAND